MNPYDLQYLLDGIINITRGIGELTNLVTEFQANPSKDLLKSLRDKNLDIEFELRIFENFLDVITEDDAIKRRNRLGN